MLPSSIVPPLKWTGNIVTIVTIVTGASIGPGFVTLSDGRDDVLGMAGDSRSVLTSISALEFQKDSGWTRAGIILPG